MFLRPGAGQRWVDPEAMVVNGSVRHGSFAQWQYFVEVTRRREAVLTAVLHVGYETYEPYRWSLYNI